MPATLNPPPAETLREGQEISRAEFLRICVASEDRYKNAERIDGRVVLNAASVRRELHGEPHAWIVGLLAVYCAQTPGTEVGDNSTAQIDDDHDPQPDAYLLIKPECGGRVRFTADDYIVGAPELIVEIAGESLSKDLGRKKDVYDLDGCEEYLVWATEKRRFFCFRRREGSFIADEPEDGVFESSVFPGLRLDIAALASGDLPGAMRTLQASLAERGEFAFPA